MKLDTGILIAVEGIDGAGKTTQVARIRDALSGVGLNVVTTKEPTNGVWGQRLRASAAAGRLGPVEELELFMKDREDHHERLLRPGIAAGDVILVDRYFGSSAAYQGSRGIDEPESILASNEARFLEPDIMFLIETSPEEGRRRIRARGDEPNEFEGLEQLRGVEAAFAELERDYLIRIDGEQPIAQVTAECLRAIAAGPLFRKMCKKQDRLDACEPAPCGYRMAGDCSYPRVGGLGQPSQSRAWIAMAVDETVSLPERVEAIRQELFGDA